jgi:hypothetical protein
MYLLVHFYKLSKISQIIELIAIALFQFLNNYSFWNLYNYLQENVLWKKQEIIEGKITRHNLYRINFSILRKLFALTILRVELWIKMPKYQRVKLSKAKMFEWKLGKVSDIKNLVVLFSLIISLVHWY